MNAEKVRNLTDGELKQQERDQMDQLFRLKFQMKMGQTESLNKIRSLRRGVARLKTISRERELGLHTSNTGEARPAAKPAKAAKVKAAAPVAKAKASTAKVKAKAPAKKSAAKKSEKR